VVLVELEADGSFGHRRLGGRSHNPYGADRQSRAHSSLMLGNGQFATTEIGHDTLSLWHFSAATGRSAARCCLRAAVPGTSRGARAASSMS
jgi:hypothetical protein